MGWLYQYDSRKLHQPFSRSTRFSLYVLCLFFLTFAVDKIYAYFTYWSTGENPFSSQFSLIIGLLSLLFALAGVVVTSGKLLKNRGYKNYQTLDLTEQSLSWRFTSEDGLQSVNLSDVAYAYTDPRHLVFKLKNDEEIWLENYLLTDRAEWDVFLTKLKTVVEIKANR